MQISVRRLLHNRVELLLTFIVPIAFFSVFALIFGNGIGSGTTTKVKVAIVDSVGSKESSSVAERLRENPGLRVMDDPNSKSSSDANELSELVRRGTVTIGILLKPTDDASLGVDLLSDASDKVASQVVSAFVGRELVLSKSQQASVNRQAIFIEGGEAPESDVAAIPAAQPWDPSDAVQVVDVIGEGKANPVVSMYASGIAVMFLLFGATGGGGVLLEERESSTLDRILSTRLTIDQLLLGKWFYLTVLGFVQVTVMFLWGQAVFGVDLIGHLDGFVMMTLVTSSAAAAFGLCLATLCKSRGQLNGLSVIVVLTMSALGGSMVPRYVMSEEMQEIGLWTFNAWALDGYDKVFWRDLSVDSLWPQLGVLMIAGVTFLLVARALAIRWESD